ncbi:uncharacterized protein LOC113848383 [Abrus precatorius]|uniref:Uncharacterized protein LOC113848383 n=1 Tax=Abrus precatorius TaxID=3816 RepID=A0A8B8JQD7_ABRPR|nr:uncharacterized protein LOC113848383 [Abrus precatorius]
MGLGRVPVRFERVAAAFDADVTRVRLFKSNGSEHSREGLIDLSDLVKSFMEREEEGEDAAVAGCEGEEGLEIDSEWSDSEKREMLEGIFGEDGDVKENIRREVEIDLGLVGDYSSPGFKRHLMARLRQRGFDAGLCKSKCEKNRRFPVGDYDYVDVNIAGNRYIIEISLVAEFEIARPTNQYASLLSAFPRVFVGKVEELKLVVRLMCNAIQGSMKSMDLHIPPWRRNGYMQAKWFSSYERTTNEVVATRKASSPFSHGGETFSTRKSVGFEARSVKSYNCRDDYRSKDAFRVGHLTNAFNAEGLGMQL